MSHARQGRLTAAAWVYRDDDAQAWRRAADWPELKPLLGPCVPAAPAAGLTPDQLRRIKIYAELDATQLATLLNYLEPVDVRQFSVLFRQGDPGDGMYSVLSGEVRARLITQGQERTLLTLAAGDSFGELALLIEGERATDVVANTDARLLRLPAAVFPRFVRDEPALAAPILLAVGRSLAHRARALGERLVADRTLAQYAGSISM